MGIGRGEKVGDAFVRINYSGDKHGLDEEIRDDLKGAESEFEDSGERSSDAWNRGWSKGDTARQKNFDTFIRNLDHMSDSGEDWRATLDRMTKSTSRWDRDFSALRETVRKADLNLNTNTHWWNRHADAVERDDHWLGRLNDHLDKTATVMGNITGRGSRNNFLNFIGVMTERIARLAFLAPKVAESILGIGKAGDAAVSGGGMAAIGPFLLKAAGGAALLAAGTVTLVAVLGPLVALLSGLLGILLALSGTVIYAVVGALAALAGAALPAVAAIGGLLTIFVGAGDRMSKATKPIVDAFHGIRDAARDSFFGDGGLDQVFSRLGDRMAVLEPLAGRIGSALRSTFDNWAHDLDSPAFDQFVRAMTRFLPGAIRDLGHILSNTFGGLAGLLRGMVPITQDFLDWLTKITGEFEAWANSRQGQEQIRQFLSDAADSAKSLGGFLRQAGGLLGDLISTGRDEGDRMFDGITTAIQRLRAFISEPITMPTPMMGGHRDPEQLLPDASESQTRMDAWFRFAEDLAAKLGDAAVAAGKMIDELDDAKARENILTILDGLAKIIEAMTWIEHHADDINPFSGLMAAGSAGLEVARRLKKFLDGVDWGNLLPDFRNFAPGAKIISGFTGLGPKIVRAIGKIDVSGIVEGAAKAAGGLVSDFIGIPGKILDKVSPVDTSKIITGAAKAAGDLVSAFIGIPGKILEKISPVDVGGIISGAASAAQGIVNAFLGLGGRILSAIGSIDIGSLIHVPDPGPGVPFVPGIATGGWFGKTLNGPMLRWVGEDGPEAIVPLDRNLAEVDPSVRWLSALAQGKVKLTDGGSSKSVDASGWVITSNTEDSRAVAAEVVNYLAAASF